MAPKNRYDRLSKRGAASSPPAPVYSQDMLVIQRGKRRGGRRRARRRLIVFGSAVWILATIGAAVFFSLRPRPVLVPPTERSLPRSFPIRVAGAAVHGVKDVKAVWVRQGTQGGQLCDFYEVRGRLRNRKRVGDGIALEVTMYAGNDPKDSKTFVQQVPPGAEKSFTLLMRDFSFARERRVDIHFVLSVSE